MPKVPIFNIHTLPDTSGDALFQGLKILATNDQWGHGIGRFNDSGARDGIYVKFRVPDDYASGAGLLVEWTSPATSGDWECDFDYRAVGGNDTESIDQSGTQEAVNLNDTAPSAAFEKMFMTISLTDGNFTAGDEVQGYFLRDGTDAGDTLASQVIIVGAYFDYTKS